MTDIIVDIMIEVLTILAMATKEVKQRRSSESISSHQSLLIQLSSEKFLKKLMGKNDIEDALKRLDTLTQEEARIATAEIFKVTNKMADGTHMCFSGHLRFMT